MKIEKTLANCTLPEFLRQSLRVKRCFTAWNEKTGFVAKLRFVPEYPDGATDAEKREIRNNTFLQHLDDALGAALDEHAESTAELIGLACFIEPENIGDYKPVDLVAAVYDMAKDADIRDFFASAAAGVMAG